MIVQREMTVKAGTRKRLAVMSVPRALSPGRVSAAQAFINA